MTLSEKIVTDIKTAMKAGDKLRLETLRSLRATILEFEKSGTDREMNSDDEIKMLNSAAKKRRDAIELYEKGGREDMAESERKELAIIKDYLPEQMSEDDLRKGIEALISSIGASGPGDFGKAMGAAMKEFKGKADGTLVKNMVKELLG